MNEDTMTIEELKKHVGEVLLFYYHDMDSYNQSLGTVAYMKKVTRINYYPHQNETDIARNIPVYGTELVILSTSSRFSHLYNHTNFPHVKNLFTEELSNCFTNVRKPTEEEMKIYKNAIRRERIFGKSWKILKKK